MISFSFWDDYIFLVCKKDQNGKKTIRSVHFMMEKVVLGKIDNILNN